MKPALDRWHLDAATTASLKAEGEKLRALTAAKRAARATTEIAIGSDPIERRTGEDRRKADRRFQTMQDKLAAEAKRHAEEPDSVRFTGSPSGFMDSLK